MMVGVGVGAICTPIWCKSCWNSNPTATSRRPIRKIHMVSPLSLPPLPLSQQNHNLTCSSFKPSASPPPSPSVTSAKYMEEPATSVKFQTSLSIPGRTSTLSLLGTGYREKVFAIIGVKVYAAGLYVNPSVVHTLNAWKGQSASEIQENSALFSSMFRAPFEKSLQIVLVRDVDGKTFWDALDDAISPRIKVPTAIDDCALSTFRSVFQGKSLSKGTFIFLTWLDHSKMLVCISSDGMPSSVDATIESENVTFALFDVFLGDSPVSTSLKASVANGLSTIL